MIHRTYRGLVKIGVLAIRRLWVVLRRMVRHITGRGVPFAVRIIKKWGKVSHRWYKAYVAPVIHKIVRGAKCAYGHTILALHAKLSLWWHWYAHWHHTRLHRIVHWSVASTGVVLVLTLATMLQVATNALSDLTDTWNFATPSDYTADSGAEIVGGVARLKAQNYTTDANTSALYHFDETNGTTAADSSSNNNPLTVSGATFGAGNLNNALTFNGTTDKASAPDTTANSFTQKNTIEAWTKLNVPFSAGAAQKQTVVDKGDYKLYYDNATGKVTYELANTGTVTWSSIGSHASFVANEPSYSTVYASAVYNNEKYYGLGSYNYGDADVWKYNGTAWMQIGGDGLNGSWSSATGSYNNVLTLVVYNNDLYASIYGGTLFTNEIWKYNGTAWTQIGGDGLNGSWNNGLRVMSRSMVVFGSSLYATVGYTNSGASLTDANEVWRWDGAIWTRIGGAGLNGSWNVAHYNHGAGTLYASASKLYYGSSIYDTSYYTAEVWSYDGVTWTKIGGNSWGNNGVNGSWNASAVHTSYSSEVSSIGSDGTNIYIALWGNGQSADHGGVDIWKWDGTTWTRIGGAGLNGSWNAYSYSSAPQLKWDGASLYVGISSMYDSSIPSVWKLTNGTWSKWVGYTQFGNITSINDITFDGSDTYVSLGYAYSSGAAAVWKNNGSAWTRIGGDSYGNSWRATVGYAIRTTTILNGSLYVGMGMYSYAKSGDAQVYRYGGSGTTWTKIGGNGVNNSWNYDTGSYYGVSALYAYNSNIYAGLNGVAGDAELWKYDGTTWTKIGGDGINSSWASGTYTGVRSIIAYNGNIYAGIGSGSSGDAELWKFDGSNWTKVGGDGVNGSWLGSGRYAVKSLVLYNGNLTVGVYASGGTSGEVWSYNGTAWTQIGGGATGQWSSENYARSVDALAVYGNKLYAAIGAGNADGNYGSYGSGTVWQYDGTAWTRVGGRYTAGSWTDYANIDSMIVYNGQLYTAIALQYNTSQIWRFNGGSWTRVASDGSNGYGNSGYTSPPSLATYSNKLCAGIGNYYGGYEGVTCSSSIGVIQSTTTSQDTAWHHIAGTYDGETMKLYIDGVLNNSTTVSLGIPDSGAPLLVGNSHGGSFAGDTSTGGFNGSIDEVRLSNQARTSFTTQPYVATAQAITLAGAVRKQGVWHWDALSDTEAPHGGNITYRLSSDGGTTWQYWNGSVWASSSGLAQANPIATTTAHIADFPVTFDGIQWQAVLQGDGTQQVTLNGVTLDATSDYSAPSMAGSSITAAKTQGGAALASNAWTNSGAPSFTWSAGSDGESGIKGYCAYLGTSDTADPITTKGLLGVSPLATGDHCQFAASSAALDTAVAGIMASQLTTSNSPYYLTLRALDKAGNVSADTAQFRFRFDNTPPTASAYITAPSGYVNTKDITMTWPISGNGSPDDANSGFAGLQYRVGATGTWYGDSHTGTGDITDLLTNDGSYRTSEDPDYPHLSEGVNTVYFRAWDNAGNVSVANATAALKINTMGAPSEPQSITATPGTNTTNAFAFSWNEPSSYIGDASHLSYCYTVNIVPSAANCTFTSPGTTSLAAGPYATQPGINTLYVVAKDESDNINYSAYDTAQFTANTPAPGLPLNTDIADVSIKATHNWRLALTWEAPTDVGAGVASYKVYRSTDGTHFTQTGSSTSTSFIDTNLSSQPYTYKVEACDNANNCGAFGSIVTLTPTGKFTSPATMVADPKASEVTTKKATINWSTDRGSDSRVALGTTSGIYARSEIANSSQTSAHELQLDNLAAGTTYYYVAKWTDEDGNTGTSQEYSFTTAPPPTLKEIATTTIGLSNATITFTSKSATKVSVYYGTNADALSGLQSVNTSAAESSYNVGLTGLSDGTKYYYKLVSYDSEGTMYDGSIATFTTPQRPRIANLKFQPVDGEPTSTQRITWTTNVPTTSAVTYGKVGTLGTDIQASTMVTNHELTVRDLDDDSQYFLVAASRDVNGNLAESDRQIFHTALDTRPPKVSNVTVEASIRGTGAEARGQIVVSWHTDELATSQVAYGEGAGLTTFNNRTAEDTGLSFEHIVIISDLPTSKVYSVQPVARDKAGNTGKGTTQSAIIGRASDSVLTIVLNVLKGVFGL